MARAWRSLLTSSLIALCLSGAKLLHFCFTGLKEGLAFSLWVMIVGSIPPISSCFKTNTSTFCFKKWMRRSLTSSASLDLIGPIGVQHVIGQAFPQRHKGHLLRLSYDRQIPYKKWGWKGLRRPADSPGVLLGVNEAESG